jgi:hypothetical protein
MGLSRFISAYRVAHRLPGRIRIRIPVLAKLPVKWRTFLNPAAELIRSKSGIKTVEIQPATGSLLITYDSDQIDEARILAWLESLVDDFINLGTLSEPLTATDIRYRISLLRNRRSHKSVL